MTVLFVVNLGSLTVKLYVCLCVSVYKHLYGVPVSFRGSFYWFGVVEECYAFMISLLWFLTCWDLHVTGCCSNVYFVFFPCPVDRSIS